MEAQNAHFASKVAEILLELDILAPDNPRKRRRLAAAEAARRDESAQWALVFIIAVKTNVTGLYTNERAPEARALLVIIVSRRAARHTCSTFGFTVGRNRLAFLELVRLSARLPSPVADARSHHAMWTTPKKKSRVVPQSLYELSAPVLASVPKEAPDSDGIQWLEGFDGLFATQRLDMMEGSVLFSIAPIVKGAELPEEPNQAFAYPLRAAMEDMPGVLRAKEMGPCGQRTCCPLSRGFGMTFQDNEMKPYMDIERPFVCEPCCCWPTVFMCSQHLRVRGRVSPHMLQDQTARTPAKVSLLVPPTSRLLAV